ncbi:MAG: hypothetical protein JWN86_2872 [Planctomycetota bacterium]|nr:hypothetical protein [Planctomycetota bacterium]
MFKYSRRVSRCVPGFDSLEARGLLSHFASPAMSAPTVERAGAAPPAFLLPVSGGFAPPPGGQADSRYQPRFVQAAGGASGNNMPTPGDARPAYHFDHAFMQADHSGQPTDVLPDRSPGRPMTLHGPGFATDQPMAVASDRGIAPGFERLIASLIDRGLLAPSYVAPAMRASESVSEGFYGTPNRSDLHLIAAPGDSASPTTSTAKKGGEDLANPASAAVTSGLARSINVASVASPFGVPLGPPNSSSAEPVPQTPQADPPAGSTVGDANSASVNRGLAEGDLPTPLGADLLMQLAPFDRESLEDSITWLFNRFEDLSDPLKDEAHAYPYLFPVAFAVVALETARRWRKRRSSAGVLPTRRTRSSVLNGLF